MPPVLFFFLKINYLGSFWFHTDFSMFCYFCKKKNAIEILIGITLNLDLPGGSDNKDSACNSRDPGSIPGLGRSPGEGNGNPLHNSCLGNPMARGAWRAIVHEVVKSWMHLSTYIFLHTNCQSHKTHLSSSEINTVFTQLLSLPLTIFPTRWPD